MAQLPYTRNTVKGTLKQGGINTPMFISGKQVARTGTEDNLVNGTDLFATFAEIAGLTLSEYNDSRSLKSLFSQSKTIREYQYSEVLDGNTDSWTISNGTYKLIVMANGNEEMYELSVDPYEENNLLKGVLTSVEQSAKEELDAELSNIRQ